MSRHRICLIANNLFVSRPPKANSKVNTSYFEDTMDEETDKVHKEEKKEEVKEQEQGVGEKKKKKKKKLKKKREDAGFL